MNLVQPIFWNPPPDFWALLVLAACAGAFVGSWLTCMANFLGKAL